MVLRDRKRRGVLLHRARLWLDESISIVEFPLSAFWPRQLPYFAANQIPVVFPQARPGYIVRNPGESLLLTHLFRELTAKLQCDSVVITANRLLQDFPKPLDRSNVSLHLLSICHVPYPQGWPPLGLPLEFRIDDHGKM